MAQSSSEATKNTFSDVVSGLCQEHKALVRELYELKQQDIALAKEEAKLREAHDLLDAKREEIEQAMLHWAVMFKAIKQKEDKARGSRRALDQQKTRVKDKIELFENLLPSSGLSWRNQALA